MPRKRRPEYIEVDLYDTLGRLVYGPVKLEELPSAGDILCVGEYEFTVLSRQLRALGADGPERQRLTRIVVAELKTGD